MDLYHCYITHMDVCKYNNRRGTSVTRPLAFIQDREKRTKEKKTKTSRRTGEQKKQVFARFIVHNWIMKSCWLVTSVWVWIYFLPFEQNTYPWQEPPLLREPSMDHFQSYHCCDCTSSAPPIIWAKYPSHWGTRATQQARGQWVIFSLPVRS
jgi:hypothetical protein